MLAYVLILIVGVLALACMFFMNRMIVLEHFDDMMEYIYIPPQSVMNTKKSKHWSPFGFPPLQNFGIPFGQWNTPQMVSSLSGLNVGGVPWMGGYGGLPFFGNESSSGSAEVDDDDTDGAVEDDTYRPSPGSVPVPSPGSAPVPSPGSAPVPSPGSAPVPSSGSAPVPSPESVSGSRGTSGTTGNVDANAIKILDEYASLHQSESDGEFLNPEILDPIFKKLGLPDANEMIKKISRVEDGYNGGQNQGEAGLAGAYVALITAAKFKLLPPETFRSSCPDDDKNICQTAQKCYGNLKYLAIKNKINELKAKLIECMGKKSDTEGSYTHGLSDDELMTIWKTNEHHNLHCCLNPSGPIGSAAHVTSLNNRSQRYTDVCKDKNKCANKDIDKSDIRCQGDDAWPKSRSDESNHGDGSLCNYGWLGGYNDTGRDAQWGWYRNALKFNTLLGIT